MATFSRVTLRGCTYSPRNSNGTFLRHLVFAVILSILFSTGCCTNLSTNQPPQLISYRPSDVVKGTQNEAFVIPAGESTSLLLIGQYFTSDTVIKFSDHETSCDLSVADLIGGGKPHVMNSSFDEEVQIASLQVSLSVSSTKSYYFCVFGGQGESMGVHQGSDRLLTIVVQPRVLPIWVEAIFIVILMALSGLFSGLNLGLMALDPTTLKIIMQSGSKRQRGYAKHIYRVRRHGNYLLCTLLLGNVLVNSTLTILLDDVLPSGIYAVIASTLAIVIFGEIIPQAICSRHGLVIGAWTIWLTYIFMVITFPISLPLSLLLNLVLGKEIGAVYNREQLLKLLDVTQEHHDLEGDEVNIISGVLAFKKKTAESVMTKFDDVYLLNIDSVLDFKTMKEIYESGFSRIPVYENNKQDIVGLLYVRDLAFVDPDDQIPLERHLQFYKHDLLFFYHDTTLDEILQGFSEGKCHLGIVQEVVTPTEGDPFYQVVGVVTLEDIVEEILQREIVDETDRFVDNRTMKPRERKHFDIGDFMESSNTPVLSSQQRLAVYQFLSSGVEPFKEQYISSNVLKRLLKNNIVQKLSYEDTASSVYSVGTPASFFLLVLEGCMQVQVGKDGLEFESRAFSHFGAHALLCALDDPPGEYVPDFTMRPTTDSLVIIITRSQYLAARKATIFEEKNYQANSKGDGDDAGGGKSSPAVDVFTKEWEIAESNDIETCHSSTSGLSSITKFLSRKSRPWLGRTTSDQRQLLSSVSSDTSSSSSSEEEGRAMEAVHVNMDGNQARFTVLGTNDSINNSDYLMSEQSVEFRTSTSSHTSTAV